MASPDTQAAPNGAAPNGNGAQVATVPKQRVALGGAQNDLDSLWRLCDALSKAQLLPQALRGKPADVLIIVLYGQELGCSPIQSIQGIYVVNGKPQIAGQLWLAKLQEAGHDYEIVHGENQCTVTITRGDNGRKHTETFTLDDAKRAKLVNKDTYQGYPKRMLMWRAVSDCATVSCPDVALGFGIAEVAHDTAERGGIDPTAERGASPLAGVVGPGAAVPTPEAVDAALAQTPAAQPGAAAEPIDAEVVDDPAPSQDELADAYRQMDAEIVGQDEHDAAPAADEPVRGEDGLTDDERTARDFWGDQATIDEKPAGRGRGGRK